MDINPVCELLFAMGAALQQPAHEREEVQEVDSKEGKERLGEQVAANQCSIEVDAERSFLRSQRCGLLGIRHLVHALVPACRSLGRVFAEIGQFQPGNDDQPKGYGHPKRADPVGERGCHRSGAIDPDEQQQ